ncbi:MAG TPA: DMT family transporter [Candidatus Limnocylindrales bacterium]|jgi:drug/metabolite transporter (DMT)-like permease|nr:DMT family transporter [Candidatus Limnocylindrales bacterium]
MTSQPAAPVDRLAIGAALVTVVLWASAFVGIRAAAADLSPGSLAFGRLLIGTIALGALVAVRPWQRPGARDLVLIAASGLVWFALYNVTLNEAERNVDAGTAAMLVNTGPIFIALLAGAFLGEGLPARLLAGCVVAFAGTAIIGIATSAEPVAGGDATWGILLCVVAAFAYAAGVTLQKPALRRVPALQLTWLACLTGTVACLPFAPGLVGELGTAEPASITWLVYLGLFPTAIAFTTWAFALSRTQAGKLGSMTYLVPPVVILLGWLLLREVPTPLAIAGGALCIAGVVVARSTGRPWMRARRTGAADPQPEAAPRG